MGLFGGGNKGTTKLSNIRVTQSVLGNPVPVVLGAQRIQQALVWMGGFTSKKGSAGGKGLGGGKGSFYLYAADVLAALCAGPVTGLGDVWSGQAWLNNSAAQETITIASVYAPANAVLLLTDNGVGLANTYSQSFTDYGAPAATVLSGTDLTPLTQVPYGTALTTGQYSINPASIGTFVLTAVANASGGNTVYTGTFTGGTSPYGSGASNAYAGFMFVVKGFVNGANNGTFLCVASTAASVTLVNVAGIAETHAATAQETGNTYHFAAADAGKTAVINYKFKLNALLAEELDLVPAGHVITVGGTFQPITDMGVWYYNPGGANDGVRLSAVSGTPTVAGTYKFHNNGGLGGGTYTFSAGDTAAEVRIKYGYQDNANVGQDQPRTLNFELIGGGQSQAPWSLLTSNFPQAALGYTKIALVGYAPMNLGTSATVQDNTFEVFTPDAFGNGVVDCNPVQCILRVLTDKGWGLGAGRVPFPPSALDNGPGGTWGYGAPSAGGLPGGSVTKNPTAVGQTGADWINPTALINPNGHIGFVSFNDSGSGTEYANHCNCNIPTDAIPTGVAVKFTGSGFDVHGTGVPTTLDVSLETTAGVAAGTKAAVPVGVNSTIILGGPTDMFGLTLTAAQVNAVGFGAGFKVGAGAAFGSDVWNVQITVYYSTTPGTRSTASTAFNWFAAQNFFISPIIDSQGTAASHIAKWLEAGMCAAFMSEGLLKLVPYGDTSAAANGCTWTAPQNFIVALDDTCFESKEGEDPVKLSREAWQDAHNEVQVQWNNRANQYAPEITPEFDQSSIDRYGLRIEDPKTWDFITTLPAAIFAANMRLKRGVNIRNTYAFNLPFCYSYLEPMDIVTISTTSVWAAGLNNVSLGVNNLPVRITKIVDDPVNGLSIEAEDYPWGTHQPVLFNKGISAGDIISNAFADPGTSQIVMFEAPSRLTGYAGNEIWIGGTGDDDWGSCNVWVSQDGTKYKEVGTIEARARLGTLDTSLATGTDPDTTHPLVVDLAVNSPALESGTSTDADSGNLLCFIDGEIISYSVATASGQDQYTMGTYIRRGQMGSVIGAHAAGSLFLRLDDAVFKFTYDPTWAGQTLYFKFQSVNTFGNKAQDLSTLTAVLFTVPGKNPGTIDASSGLVLVKHSPGVKPVGKPLPPVIGVGKLGWTDINNVPGFELESNLGIILLESGSVLMHE